MNENEKIRLKLIHLLLKEQMKELNDIEAQVKVVKNSLETLGDSYIADYFYKGKIK